MLTFYVSGYNYFQLRIHSLQLINFKYFYHDRLNSPALVSYINPLVTLKHRFIDLAHCRIKVSLTSLFCQFVAHFTCFNVNYIQVTYEGALFILSSFCSYPTSLIDLTLPS